MSLTKRCRLCVGRCDEGKSLYDDSGQANALHGIIVKYFHPTIIDIGKYRHLTSICRHCWRQVWKFCNFQKSIHEAQIKLLDEEVQLEANKSASVEPPSSISFTQPSVEQHFNAQIFHCPESQHPSSESQHFDELINIETDGGSIELKPIIIQGSNGSKTLAEKRLQAVEVVQESTKESRPIVNEAAQDDHNVVGMEICPTSYRQPIIQQNFNIPNVQSLAATTLQTTEPILPTSESTLPSTQPTFNGLINIQSMNGSIELQQKPNSELEKSLPATDTLPEEEFISQPVIKQEKLSSDLDSETVLVIDDSSSETENSLLVVKKEVQESEPFHGTYGLSVNDTLTESDLTDSTKRPSKCYICKKFVKTRKALRLHMDLYHSTNISNEPVECKICHCILENNMALYVHYHCGHQLATYSYSCTQCNELFNKMDDYQTHLSLAHGRESYQFGYKQPTTAATAESDSNDGCGQNSKRRRKQTLRIKRE
ncbi:uncharacterized protein isoform X6 [Musca autumnalis]|uniref:uncharacterized protein isoform X6 n=1 Tax=Musca autumnalis TaxID=221902 RepID=UPI003CF731B5